MLERPQDRYRPTHILVHQYVQTHLQDLVQSQQVVRLIMYFSNLAQALTQQQAQGLRQLAAEQSHILSVLKVGQESQAWSSLLKLSADIDEYLDLQCQWEARVEVNQIRQRAAQSLSDQAEIAQSLIRAGIAQYQLNQLDLAETQIHGGLELADQLGIPQLQIWCALILGHIFLRGNQFDQAEHWYKRCHQMAKQNDDVLRQAMALNGLGNIRLNQGKIQAARDIFEESLVMFRIENRHEPDREMAKALDNLAVCYRKLGDFDKAIQYHHQTLKIFQTAGEIHSEILITMRIGSIYLEQKQLDKAISLYEHSRKLSQTVNHLYSLKMLLANLGILYRRQKHYDKALEMLLKSQEIEESFGDERGLGSVFNSFARIYQEQAQFEKALSYYQSALTLFRKTNSLENEAITLAGLGDMHTESQDYTKAFEYFQQSADLFEACGNLRYKLYALRGLALVHRAQGQEEQAQTILQEAFDQAQSDWPEYQDLLNLMDQKP